jgi:hypothetical protein
MQGFPQKDLNLRINNRKSKNQDRHAKNAAKTKGQQTLNIQVQRYPFLDSIAETIRIVSCFPYIKHCAN